MPVADGAVGAVQGPPVRETTFRHTAMALPVLVLLVVFMFGAIAAAIAFTQAGATTAIILSALGITFAGCIGVLLTAYRVHRWELAPDGVRITERPKVPFMGHSRRALVPYAEIEGLYRVESGFDHLLEIVTRGNERYAMLQGGALAPLADFAPAIRAAAAEAGAALAEPGEGLSFWNRPAGLAFFGAAFVITVLFAAAALITLFSGEMDMRPRGGEMVAIVTLLPFGVAWVIWKSWRRRRAVLSRNAAR